MFTSFPLFLLKRGFQVIIKLDPNHFLITGDATPSTRTATLSEGVCRSFHTVPDEEHLRIMKTMIDRYETDQIAFTLPIYTWTLAKNVKISAKNVGGIDVSYSGSRIQKTYLTMMQTSGAASGDAARDKYRMEDAKDAAGHGGARSAADLERLYIDVNGNKYPSPDSLQKPSIHELMAYTEFLDGGVGCDLIQYATRKFYTVFDYTGARNIFAVPHIQTEDGEKTSSRFI